MRLEIRETSLGLLRPTELSINFSFRKRSVRSCLSCSVPSSPLLPNLQLTTYRQPPVQPRTPMSWPPPCMHAHLLRLDLAPIQAWIWLTKADPHLKLPPIASLELPSCLADLLMTRSLPNSSRSLNLCSPKVLTLNMKATSFPVNFL